MRLRPGILLALSFITIVCMSSCVHKYICQCEISYSGQPGLPDTVVKEYDITDTKKKAEQACDNNSTSYTKDSIKTVEDCHLY